MESLNIKFHAKDLRTLAEHWNQSKKDEFVPWEINSPNLINFKPVFSDIPKKRYEDKVTEPAAIFIYFHNFQKASNHFLRFAFFHDANIEACDSHIAARNLRSK